MGVDLKRYPKDWKQISLRIRARAGGRCECEGECGLHCTTGGPRRCVEMDRTPAKWAKGQVVLTVAHLGAKRWKCPKCEAVPNLPIDLGSFAGLAVCPACFTKLEMVPGDKHDKMDCRDENLKAMCNRCHLRFDIQEHVQNAKRSRELKMWVRQLALFPETEHGKV